MGRFYEQALGAAAVPEEQVAAGGDVMRMSLGATEIRLRKQTETSRIASSWPGFLYVWVEDINRTLLDCQTVQEILDNRLVVDMQRVEESNNLDILIVRDPAATTQFLVNQVPKPELITRMRALAQPASDGRQSKVLALMDATHICPDGTSHAIALFYSQYLGAAVSREKTSWSVLFSCGPSLRQTITFMEDSMCELLKPCNLGRAYVPSICLYMPSQDAFKRAFDKCKAANILIGALTSTDPSWEDAERACEFSFRRVIDPRLPVPSSREAVVLELHHVIRSTRHPEFRLSDEVIQGSGPPGEHRSPMMTCCRRKKKEE